MCLNWDESYSLSLEGCLCLVMEMEDLTPQEGPNSPYNHCWNSHLVGLPFWCHLRNRNFVKLFLNWPFWLDGGTAYLGRLVSAPVESRLIAAFGFALKYHAQLYAWLTWLPLGLYTRTNFLPNASQPGAISFSIKLSCLSFIFPSALRTGLGERAGTLSIHATGFLQ